MNDLDLLRRFEPVVRYTSGEMFFPTAVDGYLRYCSLWQRDAGGKAAMMVPPGTLTAEDLPKYDSRSAEHYLFLRYVPKPLDPLAYQQWFNSDDHPSFDSVGRLSRVGIGGRIAEALFGFSLLVRGSVPGGTTAQAQQQYKETLEADPRNVYYGRVVRDGGYTILNYVFFYVMNDWRSSFHGVNDHESDWEQIFVYLTEEDGEYVPQWVAFAAHDFSGDDLRRRWDDPELTKHGDNHVVVFAGAGSHAAYVLPGEYLMKVEPKALSSVNRVLTSARTWLAQNLNAPGEAPSAEGGGLSLAFVDYARGDGRAIGPGQPHRWSPELLTDDLPWVSGYRGLWGLDTRDPFSGERAPAGPKFERTGDVRHSWRDPLGWAGLDKVPTPDEVLANTTAAADQLAEEAGSVWESIERQREQLRAKGMTVAALVATPNLEKQVEVEQKELAKAEADLKELSGTHAELLERERLVRAYGAFLAAGNRDDPQTHLKHRAVPQPPPPPAARWMDAWAAISGALFMGAIILLLVIRPPEWPLWIILVGLIFGAIEAGMRGKLGDYLLMATIILALIATVLLFWFNWRWLIPLGILLIFVYSLLVNVRELRSRGAKETADEVPPPAAAAETEAS